MKIDAKGLACPGPVIEAKKALQKMGQGTLEVLVDNEIAVQNLKKLGAYYHAELTDQKLADQTYQVIFKVNQEMPTTVTESDSTNKSGQVVVLSSEYMGNDDIVLGKLLMKGFVYALTELEVLPETVLLYNGGAKLSVNGADTLADLQTLAEQGVEIYTCGTCLKHYQIEDQLAVGAVTNMYSIAELLAQANSIVKP